MMPQNFPSPIAYYHGAKYTIKDWTISFFEPHKTFIDGFCGTAIVALSKPLAPELNMINDRSDTVVNYLRILQNDDTLKELVRRLEFTPFARSEFNLLMKKLKHDKDPIERARAFAAGSFMTPASITRPNKKPFVRVQIRHDRDGDAYSYPEKIDKLIDACKIAGRKLKGYIIESVDIREILPRFNHPSVLYYLDPTYPLMSRHKKHLTREYDFELSDQDHVEIARMVHDSTAQFVIASNQNRMYDELYSDFEMHSTQALVRAKSGGRLYEERVFVKGQGRRQMSLFAGN